MIEEAVALVEIEEAAAITAAVVEEGKKQYMIWDGGFHPGLSLKLNC
jgi:hypothetical protein